MKKLNLLFIGILSVSALNAQDISDALRYSQDEIQGTARFRALSGAFGALGGDMSAVSINPASSAVFAQSHASFTLSNVDTNNDTQYFNGFTTSGESNFDVSQGGAAFVFENRSNSPWRKFTIGVAYDRSNNYDDNWNARGTNPNNQSIDLYFLNYADGKRLDQISALPGESLADAYTDIGNVYGFAHQQAFLGFESYILEPDADDDANTTYFSNLASGTFNHNYSYASTGYNGKISFNMAAQYEDNLYLGLNLNSHFIDFHRSTLLFENNSNAGSIVNSIEFENNLSTAGNGFSFQLGGIFKLSPEFRLGVAFDSPIWYTIEEETSQYLATVRDDGGSNITQVVNPQTINVYPQYKLQTPSKLTGSLAYVFGTQGLLSFDYSRKDYSKTKFKPESDSFFTDQNALIANTLTDASTYRLGGEYKVKQFSFRGGYRFEESPYKDGTTVGDLTGYSLGVGYNFGNTKLDVTFDQSNRTNKTPLYNVGLTDAAVIDRTNSNVTLSLSFNI
ncbi:Outer membrane protein transport protein (OMPP1/FadL/TodX) [Mariniflexile rhizosphaerae]|uniref:OmpP1/FadL family transporter n=1 Tax=unclassified Mariniflexile TaxID=2643887 RepID=UPI000CBA975F|nr:outer membrane protein transport protein [Mariniflexile sp. TRM1-10]AXP79396.1 Outer membrane protein transport protein (OMPP1/FadL/TodX) [Mariniflexile sp. TRM1-10]PLB18165.1 MAG: Outer membrane transport family protein [Flavobacteriaceae bacterium FS1-H7996/R]